MNEWTKRNSRTQEAEEVDDAVSDNLLTMSILFLVSWNPSGIFINKLLWCAIVQIPSSSCFCFWEHAFFANSLFPEWRRGNSCYLFNLLYSTYIHIHIYVYVCIRGIVIMNLNYLEVIESSLSLLVYRNSSVIVLSFHGEQFHSIPYHSIHLLEWYFSVVLVS